MASEESEEIHSSPKSNGTSQELDAMTLQTFITTLAILWASPYTLLGLFLGFIGLCSGGHARIRGRVVEFYGGGVKWLLQQFFFGEGAMAFTLGHTVLGSN